VLLRERLQSLGYQPRAGRPTGVLDLERTAREIGAQVVENAHGRTLMVEEVVVAPVSTDLDAAGAALLGRTGSDGGPGRLCFFDTETTGLSGGVGTQVFLAAVAWRVPSGVLVRQYFLPDPSAERAMLHALREDLCASDTLVTYNGRSFDVPLVEARLLMCRWPGDSIRMPHVDLLHPVRRVYRSRIGSCSLGSVETQVLGRDRGEDIPGFLIPEAYFAFLRGRDVALLREVFAHNRQDVVSLSLLLDHFCRVLKEEGSQSHPLDRFGVARLLETNGQPQRAAALYERLWDESLEGWNGEVFPEAWSPVELGYVTGMRLAALHRRRGLVHLCQPILEELWRRHPRPFEAGIMLAKHLEHRRKDRRAALELVEAALQALHEEPGWGRKEERWVEDLRRRRVRLSARAEATA
jgi:uncharacterized protein YprB with RNaseH-like and TPR domain